MSERLQTRIEEVTSRQLEVARLVAEGRTNPEIASALGITLDGAKYHVSELLGRLGLERREEIRDWYRSEHRGRRLARFGALFASVPRAFATGATVAAVVGAGALVAVGLEGGRAQDLPSATATATAAPTVAALEPGEHPPALAVGDASDAPDSLERLLTWLEWRLRSDDPVIVQWERVDWFNGCFDIDPPGGCPLSVSPVPGYRVVMNVEGAEYIARTDLEVSRYAIEAAPPIPTFEVLFRWTGSAIEGSFPCLDLKVGVDGAGSISGCGQPATRVQVEQAAFGSFGFLEELLQFEAFEWQPPGSSVTLASDGNVVASAVRQRAVNEWGRFLAIESYTGQGDPSMALAISWRDAAGAKCLRVHVERYGVARVRDCPGDERVIFLDDNALARLYELLDTYEWFDETSEQRPAFAGLADVPTVMTFAGVGLTKAEGEAQAEEIWAWVTALAEAGPTAGE